MNKLDLECQKLVRRVDAICARLNPGLLAVVALLSTVALVVAVRRIAPLYIQYVAEGMQLTDVPTGLVSPDQPPASE